MNGIENISARIMQEAQQQANSILEDAKSTCEQILAKAQQQAENEQSAAATVASAKATDAQAKAVLAAGIEAKKQLSAARQELIDSAFEKALDTLVNLPEGDYVALLVRLTKDACGNEQSGELLLSPADREKYGDTIIQKAEVEGLVLSQDTAPIMGGVVVRRGKIEFNCALEVIVRMLHEEMAPRVAQALFSEGV